MTNRTKQFLIFFSLLILCLLILPLRYESNDDIFLELTYNGYFTNTIETGSLYSHFLLGNVLSFFYNNTHSLNVFGLFNILIFLTSFVLLVYLALEDIIKTNAILFSIFAIGIFCSSIINFNYSVVAFFAAFSGILGIFSNIGKNKFILNILSICLIILSILIRSQFFLLASLLSVPVVYHQFNNNKLKIILYGFLMIVSFASFQFLNIIHLNQDRSWSKYFKEYSLEKDIIDNPCVNNYYMNPHLKKISWTENDLVMYRDFYFSYPKNLNIDKLKYIKNVIPHDSMDFNEFIPSLIKFIPWYLWLLLIFVWLVSYKTGGRNHLIFNIFYLVIIFSILKYLSGNKYILKERFILPILFAYGLNCLLYLRAGFVLKKNQVLIPVILLSINLFYKVQKIVAEDKDYIVLQKYLVGRSHKNIFFDYYLSYPFSSFKNWESNYKQLNGIIFIPTGWIMNTPAGPSYLNRLGFRTSLQAISSNRTLHLVPFYKLEVYKSTMKKYCKEHFNLEVEFKMIDDIVTPSNHWVTLEMF